MNIFVAKLSFDTSEATLLDAFSQFGEVDSVKIIMDREEGRSKGFGFVEMPNDDEAYEAINALNDSELDGREIVVKKSRPKGDSGGRGGNRGGGGFRGGRDGGNRGGGGFRGGRDGGRDNYRSNRY
jgi:RNA recognition motif-containing protein